jgi:hypothetical protein
LPENAERQHNKIAMPPPQPPLNQIFTQVGTSLFITGFSLRTTGVKPFIMEAEVITFEGIPFIAPPNVLLTIASPHYVVSPIWITTSAFGLVSNKVGEPGGDQNANIYILINGQLPPGFAADPRNSFRLQRNMAKSLDEAHAMKARF